MVGLGVGEHEQVEPADARLVQPPQDRPVRRAGVDQHRGAVALQQRRVALPDVHERDDELAARGRRGPPGAGVQGRDRHGERGRTGDGEDPAPAVRSRAGHVPPARARQPREAGDDDAERGVRERQCERAAEPHRQRGERRAGGGVRDPFEVAEQRRAGDA